MNHPLFVNGVSYAHREPTEDTKKDAQKKDSKKDDSSKKDDRDEDDNKESRVCLERSLSYMSRVFTCCTILNIHQVNHVWDFKVSMFVSYFCFLVVLLDA